MNHVPVAPPRGGRTTALPCAAADGPSGVAASRPRRLATALAVRGSGRASLPGRRRERQTPSSSRHGGASGERGGQLRADVRGEPVARQQGVGLLAPAPWIRLSLQPGRMPLEQPLAGAIDPPALLDRRPRQRGPPASPSASPGPRPRRLATTPFCCNSRRSARLPRGRDRSRLSTQACAKARSSR